MLELGFLLYNQGNDIYLAFSDTTCDYGDMVRLDFEDTTGKNYNIGDTVVVYAQPPHMTDSFGSVDFTAPANRWSYRVADLVKGETVPQWFYSSHVEQKIQQGITDWQSKYIMTDLSNVVIKESGMYCFINCRNITVYNSFSHAYDCADCSFVGGNVTFYSTNQDMVNVVGERVDKHKGLTIGNVFGFASVKSMCAMINAYDTAFIASSNSDVTLYQNSSAYAYSDSAIMVRDCGTCHSLGGNNSVILSDSGTLKLYTTNSYDTKVKVDSIMAKIYICDE